ncbi:hypothetical protein [Microbacterium sp. GXF7504]
MTDDARDPELDAAIDRALQSAGLRPGDATTTAALIVVDDETPTVDAPGGLDLDGD